ncbi:MAG: hypothetical protein U0K86_13420 [Agathobacter sp.]|nr:hypothetical protein [Agathobacter sp.]
MINFLVVVIVIVVIIKAVSTDAKRSAQQNNNSVQPARPIQPAVQAQQIRQAQHARQAQQARQAQSARAVQQKNNNSQIPQILQKAKRNNEKYADDKTLKEIEKSHNHTETYQKDKVEHSRMCHTLGKDENAIEVSENILGNIDDLMIKGYSGTLSFERDFVSEGLDMISEFTVPDTVNFSKAGE